MTEGGGIDNKTRRLTPDADVHINDLWAPNTIMMRRQVC